MGLNSRWPESCTSWTVTGPVCEWASGRWSVIGVPEGPGVPIDAILTMSVEGSATPAMLFPFGIESMKSVSPGRMPPASLRSIVVVPAGVTVEEPTSRVVKFHRNPCVISFPIATCATGVPCAAKAWITDCV